MMDDGIATQVADFAEAVRTADVDGIRAFLSEDYFGHERAADEPSQADRWADLVPDVVAALPDLRIEIEDVSSEDGLVHVRAVVEGTHTGVLWGAPPTGATIRFEVPLTLRPTPTGWTVQGDAPPVAVASALRQVGVIPPPDQMHLPPANPTRPPEFLLKLAFTGLAQDKPCGHLDRARVFEPTTHECAQCVASGDIWPALRMCLACGFVGCCDTSVNKHMHRHYEATGHGIFRSLRLAERWIWCYDDAAFFEGGTLDRLAAAVPPATSS